MLSLYPMDITGEGAANFYYSGIVYCNNITDFEG